jgi:hypothetical protein
MNETTELRIEMSHDMVERRHMIPGDQDTAALACREHGADCESLRRLDMCSIVDALSLAGVPAEVTQTGGGVATIFAGAADKRLAIGPGYWVGERAFCDPSDLMIGLEDQSADPVSLSDATTSDAVVHRALVALGKRPAPCTSPNGLECEEDSHGHKYLDGFDWTDQQHGPTGELLCNDCGAPIFWDEKTCRYWHTDPTAPPCPLVTEVR